MKIFLAGPFFNPAACEMLQGLLDHLEGLGHTVFCAMRDGKLVPKDATEEVRQKFFKLDVDQMFESELVVAMLDYPMPENQALHLVTMPYSTGPSSGLVVGPKVELPDAGTVFEMGLAYANGNTPIIGFTSSIKSLNLMLAQSCIATVENYRTLSEIVKLVELGRFDEIEKQRKELFNL